MENKSASIIKVMDLSKIYHLGSHEVRALDGVSLEIYKDEFLGIVGSSGSGKTTLLNLIAGLDTPTSGSIETPFGRLSSLSSKELAQYRRDRVGMVFQTFHLIPHRTALQNVETALLFSNMKRNVRQQSSEEALDKLGLKDRLNHKPSDLSGGEQQRVALARALVKKPALLLADEPTGNLDRENAQQIAELLTESNMQGVTIVLVTHDLALAEKYCSRIIRLTYGKIDKENKIGSGGGGIS